jgi:hypothetical protein
VGQVRSGFRGSLSHVRFSVQALLFIVLLAGTSIGWVARSARIQRDAVAAIRACGGFVTYDYEDGFIEARRVRNWPPWLEALIGIDYLCSVSEVRLTEKAGDAELVHVERLGNLESLALMRSRIAGAGLRRIAGMRSLRELSLCALNVSDSDLASLKELGRLKWLSLSYMSISDSGLRALEGMTDLDRLRLSFTDVRGPGLKNLRRLKRLQALYLRGTPVDDEWLAGVAGSQELAILDLGQTRVTDAGIRHLKGLRNLRRLYLDGSLVSDPARAAESLTSE